MLYSLKRLENSAMLASVQNWARVTLSVGIKNPYKYESKIQKYVTASEQQRKRYQSPEPAKVIASWENMTDC